MGDKILVPLHIGYGRAIEGLGEIGSDIKDFFDNTKDYKLVLFTGGSDIDPRIYGETSPKGLCSYMPQRDLIEAQIFDQARKFGIKMTGICRGAQLINVISGGRMMHHIEGHEGVIHEVETSKGEVFETNSLHHQMIIPPEDGYIIGWAKRPLSPFYFGDEDEAIEWNGPEAEIVLIPSTLCCGAQWHPEAMGKKTLGFRYYYHLVQKFLEMDIETFTDEYVKKATLGM